MATKTRTTKTAGKGTRPRKPPAKPATAARRRRRSAATAPPDDGPCRSAPQLAEVDADVLEFIAAIDRFKQEHGRPFPSWSEVLLVLRQLGYRRR
jgi:hypothetical protein